MRKRRIFLALGIIIMIIALSGLFLTGCATTGAKNTIESDCAPNFTVEGNLFTGTTYRSSKEFPKVTKQEVFDKVIFALASHGWQIINSNKEQGLISASEGVMMGQGRTVPLNVVIRQNKNGKNGVKMHLTFFLSGGLATSDDSVVERFCKVYKGVESGTSTKESQPTATPPSPSPTATKSEPKLQPTIPEKPEKPPAIYLITLKNSNIRVAPTIKSQIITTIKKGTKIEKISESPDWFKVRLPSGETGHIYKPLVIVIPSPEASTHDKPESPQATEKATAPIYKPLAEETQSPEASTHDESESPQATEKTTAPKLPIPPDSPFAKIKEGMGIQQVTDILGQPQDNEPYETGKFVVPFFSSSDDLVRIIYYYKGLGQIHYSLGSGRVKLIVYDPTEDGYR